MEFVSAVNCMDGRVQEPVIAWMKSYANAKFVDIITEPGPIKILSDNSDYYLVNSIKERLKVSIEKHHSDTITVVGHYDCAGNPVDKATQLKQIKNSMNLIKLWFENVKIIGL